MAKKQKLTKEQKKMKHAQAVSGNGYNADPYYPTDYNVGKRNPKKDVKPMIETARPMTTKGWIGTLVVLMIPLVNLIALIAWANKKNEKINPSKRSFARAYLIFIAIILVLELVLIGALLVINLVLFPFPNNSADASALLEEANYFVEVYEGEDAKLIALNDNVEEYLIAKNEEGQIELKMYFFSDSDIASEYLDSLGEIESDEFGIVGISGSVVYIGTEDATDAINANGMF